MTSLPAFYADPARSLLALAPGDPGFLPPTSLARQASALTLVRDDSKMGKLLGRAWRSGASADLLGFVLGGYAAAHELETYESTAIAALARLAPAPAAAGASTDLMCDLGAGIHRLLQGALATTQGDDDPCWCPDCIAEAASLN